MTNKTFQNIRNLSEGQKALWFSHIYASNEGIYNNRFAWWIPDTVNESLLTSTLDAVCNHHEALRSTYHQEDGTPFQVPHEVMAVDYERYELASNTEEELLSALDSEVRLKQDLTCQSSIRWKLFLQPGGRRVLLMVVQHINLDQWSVVTLLNQVKAVYAQLEKGEPVNLPQPDKTFSDFVDDQEEYIHSDEGSAEMAFWQAQLKGAEFNLNLPLDFSRREDARCQLGYYCEPIPESLVKKFNNRISELGVSLFSVYLGAFQLLLGKYTGQQDISVTTPTAGRGEEYQGVFNYFVNPMISRVQFEPSDTLASFLKEFGTQTSERLERSRVPLPRILQKCKQSEQLDGSPFQVNFFFHNINRFENRETPLVSWDLDGKRTWHMGALGEWEHIAQAQQLDDFDITFKIYKLQSHFFIGIEFNSDLFKPSTIQAMAGHYRILMEAIVTDVSRSIADICILSDNEKYLCLKNRNKTKSYYNPTRSLPFFFEKNAQNIPNKIALEADDKTLTFKQLDDESNKVAAILVDSGLAPESKIGVFLPRSIEAVITFLGIIKSGMVYLPLDPEYPKNRLDYIIQDANPAFIVSNQSLKGAFDDIEIAPDVLVIEDVLSQSLNFSSDRIQILPEQLAYIIYTSGSTGNPKGVMIEHRSVAHLIHSQRKAFSLGPGDHIPQFSSLNFDISIFELVLSLQTGATLHLTTKEHILGGNLLGFLQSKEISWTLLSPALLNLIEPVDLPKLKTVIVGGDVCSADLAKRWSKGRTFCNAYGPTEYTVWTSINEVDGSRTPPIGKPVANTQTYILDPHLNPVPIGVPGELHIGGDGLARGYLNRPDLTAEKFIPNPFSDEPGSRLYKTGDLCRYLEDGNIEFLGRIDHQVKIRGFRVELGEIESVLREHSAVHDVLVMARDDFGGKTGGDKQLAAYIVKNASETVEPNELRAFLKERLPDYMVPAAFVLLDAFPLTPNEKIDRKALPVPELNKVSSEALRPPRNEIERMIAKVWQQCLGLSQVSVNENFFDLGGHSLLLAQVHSRLPEVLKNKVSMVDLFKYPTIQTLAHYLEDDEEDENIFIEPDDHVERLRLRRRLMESLGGVKIAIVGMAGRFPGADTVEAFWQNICDKKESITFFTHEQLKAAGVPDDLIKNPAYVPAKGMLDSISGFEAPFFNFTPREAQITDPQQRLFLECAWEALEDAGCVPAEFDGRIGVYAGIGMNQYLMNNLSSNPDLLAQMGDYPVMIGNDKDFLSTRVSYKLNLNGPAVVLQTACSTSLVAVHTACQALLNEDCDAALAGGVSFGRLGKAGYMYQDGMIMSKDGHCRAFDAEASGTVQGQGCGIVLLKRLDDALKNHDHIYAVISGSATNNDGSNKTGYTAPSVEGQSKAIGMAQASANVNPSDISYIETHGTGTPIGDPIEIEALRQAFQREPLVRQKNDLVPKQWRCAIGSVKTNIGHLDAASGIAGMIKTAKALESKTLPPSLHFQTPNPKIAFDQSPFYVNTELKDWDNNGMPRFAGISSFGIGGSNAHVVLTEAPGQTPEDKRRPWGIVTLSARTPSALETMTERFVAHLKNHPEQSFANICYTLHVGRTVFPHRRYLVCRNRDEAIAELSPVNPGKVVTSKYVERPHKLVFLFSGQGSQYQNMGKMLYQVEITFRKAIDECREKLRQKFIHIYEELSESDYYGFSDKIHQTYITQPGLFVFEYALAKMLMSWGIEPDLMLGHSVGEYVAACLAGVFTLDQALELVTIRGHLIQGLESGEMLSVNLTETEAEKLTNHDVSIAAVNGEQRCVLSGSSKAIQYLHDLLNRKGIENRILHTSHAFHSHMMAPILERFRGYVERRKPQPPKRPYVSSLSGKLMTAKETTSPDYWMEHLRYRVRFHRAMNTVFAERQGPLLPDPENPQLSEAFIFLEVGPGRVLTTLVRQHAARQPQDWFMATTRHAYEDISDTEHLLKVIARLWEQGVKIDWDVFHSQRMRYRVPMPTYPFERKPHWIKARQHAYGSFGETVLAANEHEQEVPSDAAAGNSEHSPGDPIENRIWQVWSKALGLTGFGIYDDFFELGGDSLLAVGITDQLNSAFNVPLANHVLIQKPTIAALAEHVRQAGGQCAGPVANPSVAKEAGQGPLVVIQAGDAAVPPLIMVHPIGGEVFFYRDLARYLGKDQPLYAFQAPSLSGQGEPIDAVPQMAKRYLDELKVQGIAGPYYLGGSSFGGLVAYEMAQQLRANGETVPLLTMIDTPSPEQMPRTLNDSAAILQYLLADKLELSIERLRELDADAQIDYVLEEARLQDKASVLPLHLGVNLFKTWMAHQHATFAYQPEPYAGDVLFFRHTESMPDFPALPHAPWVARIQGECRVHQVPGDHITMNYPPHVQVLASHLKPALEQARAAWLH